jgi:hypothetical protein
MLVRLKESYEVEANPVHVTVIAGEGQKAQTVVYVDRNRIASGAKIEAFPLGPGTDLEGKELRISTAVIDTNAQTNRTSVLYRLTGGAQDQEYTLQYTVSKEKEQVDYYATFRLL